MNSPDILMAAQPVTEAFEKLGIPYYIGGSVASSAYGIPRSTLDIDMVSDLKPEHVPQLVRMLEPSYFIDEDTIIDAIRRVSSFNLIHIETMMKIDVFIKSDTPYQTETFRRKKKDKLDEEQSSPELFLASPEDIILNKLMWYRLGGCVSDRQWGDILGVLKIQKNELDRPYLNQWAIELNVSELLEKAFRDAGIDNEMVMK
ncbi:MAG: hypothetical protein AB7S77_07365 [Desulfatirhabdiaceae bacterium]